MEISTEDPQPQSQPQSALFKLNNFEIKLSYNNDQLTIDAEQEYTFKRFSITITPENIKDVTSFLFREAEVMYLDLLEAFEQKAANVKISITDDARIMYLQEREVRGKKVEDKFTLWLDEEKVDREKEQDKRIEKLLRQVAQLEKDKSDLAGKIRALEEENSRFKVVEERLTERIRNLEEKVIPEGQKELAKTLTDLEKKMKSFTEWQEFMIRGFVFDPTPQEAQYVFSMQPGNKGISYVGNSRRVLFAKPSVPKWQKTVFSIKITYNPHGGGIAIGICPSTLKDGQVKQNLHKEKGVYCYFYPSSIYANGQETAVNKPVALVTITVDLMNNTINYQSDGVSMHTSNLDPSFTNSCEYYPFVEVNGMYDSLNFV